MNHPSHSAAEPAFADIEAASRQLAHVLTPTVCIRSNALSAMSGANVILKLENMQPTGSFKSRGAYIKMCSLTPMQRQRGVVAASAGNHAQGVAYHASRLSVQATIVMPKTTPFVKIRRTEAHGARVLLYGATLSDALEHAQRLAAGEDLAFISGYDDGPIIAGAGTVALEMLREFPQLDSLLVPVGGGGLICGSAIVAKHLKPHMQVIGVQTEVYPSLYTALRELPAPVGGSTIAEGVGVKAIGSLNLRIAKNLVDDVILVDEQSIEDAILTVLEEEKILAEGAGAIAVAALLNHTARFVGKTVGIIISGGNIDTGLLASLIERSRLKARRVARLDVEIVDAPGVLARVAKVIADFDANILEVVHHRTAAERPAKCAALQVTIEMRATNDASAIAERLHDIGLTAHVHA